jgi:hypothetical protein
MRSFLVAASCALAFTAVAQGTYTMKMSMKMEGLPPEYAAYGEYDITTYIKGDKTKTEVSNMMANSTIFFDGKTMTSLSDAMGNKTGYTATKEEMEAAEKNEKKDKPKVEYTTEKKTIAGYECTKAIVTQTGKDKKEVKTIVWTTDQLKINPEARKSFRGNMTDLGDIKGHPLSFESSQNANGMDVKMIMTTTEISTSAVDDAVFSVNTDGYKMMTYKEYMDQMKQKGQH